MQALLPHRRQFLTLAGTGAAAVVLFGCKGASATPPEHFEVVLNDAAWRKKLSPAAYAVLRHENTET
ncbi:MAG: twin-arginine translocation signal domain-containing protein, partial [Sphingomonas sp.]